VNSNSHHNLQRITGYLLTDSAGFTLIELIVVLAILAMTAMLVLPRLPDTREAALKGSARALATSVRYLGDTVTTTRNPHRMRLTPGSGKIEVTVIPFGGTETPSTDTFFNRAILSEGVVVSDVQIPRMGTLNSGEVLLDFGPAGITDIAAIHLRESGGSQMTVMIFPFGGRVKVSDGYQEVGL
jgi:general secretion pathway protein H